MKWFLIIMAALLVVAAISVWYAFQRPEFFAGLTAVAAGVAWKAIWPEMFRSSPETQEKAKERAKLAKEIGDRKGRREH